MERRPKGSGSIYTLKDGTVIGQYEIETVNGKKRKYIRGKTKKEVASKLAKAVADRDSGLIYDSGSLTVSEYLDRWLDAIRETITVGTWKQYETIVRLHIKPTVGRTKLQNLNALQVQSLYREKLDSGLSARRVQYIHVTLHKALKQAIKWSLIPRNVTEAVDPPRPQKKEIRPLDEGQVKKLLKAVEGDKLEALYILAVTTGMRQGELLGLQWQDVNLETGTLRVSRTIFGGVVNPPKTAKSRRGIKLSRKAIAGLRQHRSLNHKKSNWIFCTRSGKPIDCTNLNKQSWKPLLKRAGLPDTRFHDLRHTCATLLLSKGIHPKIVQELLGHANISITLDTYSHVLPNMQQKVVEAMEGIFEGEN